MNQNKESKNFNNPLGTPLESNSELMDCYNKSEDTIMIKSQVLEYLRKEELSAHKKSRIIEAANKLLTLLD